MEADISSQAVGLASNTDFSIMSLFLRADIIVKSVIIILIASSIYSWAIIFDKIRMFKKINKSAEDFEEKFWKSKSAETFYNSLPTSINDPMAQLFKTSMQTVIKSRSRSSLSEKLPSILEVNIVITFYLILLFSFFKKMNIDKGAKKNISIKTIDLNFKNTYTKYNKNKNMNR
mgnify:CR=1 FL=1